MQTQRSGQVSQVPAMGLASVILTLKAQSLRGEMVTLGDALALTGTRMHGAAILLMALPEAIPLPIPSFGAILGVPLLIASGHLAIFGEQGLLPVGAKNIELSDRLIALMARYLIGPLKYAESLSKSRLPFIAKREKLVGAICAIMSLLLMLPVPLMNVPPAIVLVFVSWGLLHRDGVFVGLGLAMAIAVGISITFLIDLTVEALRSVVT